MVLGEGALDLGQLPAEGQARHFNRSLKMTVYIEYSTITFFLTQRVIFTDDLHVNIHFCN